MIPHSFLAWNHLKNMETGVHHYLHSDVPKIQLFTSSSSHNGASVSESTKIESTSNVLLLDSEFTVHREVWFPTEVGETNAFLEGMSWRIIKWKVISWKLQKLQTCLFQFLCINEESTPYLIIDRIMSDLSTQSSFQISSTCFLRYKLIINEVLVWHFCKMKDQLFSG